MIESVVANLRSSLDSNHRSSRVLLRRTLLDERENKLVECYCTYNVMIYRIG